MTKSCVDVRKHGECLSETLRCILIDVGNIFPDLRSSLVKDFTRLLSLSSSRGLPLFLVDLPNLDKYLLACLDSGLLLKTQLPLTRKKSRQSMIPRLFQGLYLKVFDESGVLKLDANVDAIAALRQIFSFGKKFNINCEKEKVYETLHTFYSVDQELPEPSSKIWDDPDVFDSDLNVCDVCCMPSNLGYDRECRREDSAYEYNCRLILQSVFDIVAASFGPYDPGEYRFRHGPGAVSDVRKEDNKYVFPTWPDKLEKVYPFADFAFTGYDHWIDRLEIGVPLKDPVIASKMVAVPKTYSGPRLIACEPTSHQWCQQNILDYLETRLPKTCLGPYITLRDQTQNQELARKGSIDRTLATIDLSEASDRVSCWLVERAFRRNTYLLKALASCRTQFVENKIDKKSPRLHKLKKFSTMGSACTFPIESIIFASIAIASCLLADGRRPSWRTIGSYRNQVSVFGDDIIIPTRALGICEYLLNLCYFKVNRSKTFGIGKFRESCGLDAYNGEIITPIRIKCYPCLESPESIAAVVDMSNNLLKGGYWVTSTNLAKTIPEHIFENIALVGVDSGAFGLVSFSGPSVEKTRWNVELSRWEYRAIAVTAKARKTQVEGIVCFHQYITESPSQDIKWSSGIAKTPKINIGLRWGPVTDLN